METNYIHFRKHFAGMEYTIINYFTKEDRKYLKNKGGITLAYRWHNKNLFVGIAVCNPNDNFNKKLGRQIALNRLNLCISQNNKNCDFDYFIILENDFHRLATRLNTESRYNIFESIKNIVEKGEKHDN